MIVDKVITILPCPARYILKPHLQDKLMKRYLQAGQINLALPGIWLDFNAIKWTVNVIRVGA